MRKEIDTNEHYEHPVTGAVCKKIRRINNDRESFPRYIVVRECTRLHESGERFAMARFKKGEALSRVFAPSESYNNSWVKRAAR